MDTKENLTKIYILKNTYLQAALNVCQTITLFIGQSGHPVHLLPFSNRTGHFVSPGGHKVLGHSILLHGLNFWHGTRLVSLKEKITCLLYDNTSITFI